MIQIGIGEKNACDWAVSQSRILSERLQFRSAFYLSRQVRRSIDQERALIVGTSPNARLRLRRNPAAPGREAVGTRAIPLRQATARRTPENPKANRFTPARSDRARVTRALEEDRHVFHCGFNPFFLGAFHKPSKASLCIGSAWQLAIILSLLSSKITGHEWESEVPRSAADRQK
jgi:hypothetical protein